MGSRGPNIHRFLEKIRAGPTVRIHSGERPLPTHRCKATTVAGTRCRHAAVKKGYCVLHWNGPLIREVGGYLEIRRARPHCGAKTRSGEPCQAKRLPGRDRCKWHGGKSTGPRTPGGKAKVTANLPNRSSKG